MSLKKSLSLSLLLCHFTPSSWAEITLDGSLGRGGALSGPDYAITADLGRQMGGNLFHSFRDFNLSQDEIATFSGPNTINNIISRVTGGNPSQINGLLRSTIPDAEVYLLNPAGIMFGKGAKLDVQGGFHASTANTLRLGDDGEFNVSNVEQSILTVAAPSAFGFLKDKPATITLQDSQLAVPTGKSLSLIGGDININGNLIDTNLKGLFSSRISAKSGRFNLASIASPGEIKFTESTLNLSTQAQRGSIIVNKTGIDLSGEGGGSIFIRGGHFKLIQSVIESKTLGTKDGKAINIQVEQLELQGFSLNFPMFRMLFPYLYPSLDTSSSGAGKAGSVEIEARQIELTDEAGIYTGTIGNGNGGDITIRTAEVLNLSNRSSILASPLNNEEEISNPGDTGKITIEAQQITLMDDSSITNGTLGTGNGGPITLLVRDALTVQSGNIHSHSQGAGDAGEIKITARQLTLTDSGQIGSATFSSGKGGLVTIIADDLILSGYDKRDINYSTGIYASSGSKAANNSGESGNIDIHVHQLKLTNSAQISNSTYGSGKGGTINIKADELIISQKISEGFGSAVFARSLSRRDYAGDAGNITINANIINIDNGGITTSANNASGGEINITVPNSLYLQAGTITTEVKNNQGNGGTITISSPTLAVLNNSEILTRADQGWGGKIDITADKFIRSADSLLDASSKVEGRSGEIKIEADSYVGNGLITLPESFSNPPSLRRCETQFTTQETPSHFTRANRARMRRDELKEGVWGSPLDF